MSILALFHHLNLVAALCAQPAPFHFSLLTFIRPCVCINLDFSLVGLLRPRIRFLFFHLPFPSTLPSSLFLSVLICLLTTTYATPRRCCQRHRPPSISKRGSLTSSRFRLLRSLCIDFFPPCFINRDRICGTFTPKRRPLTVLSKLAHLTCSAFIPLHSLPNADARSAEP